MGDNRTESNLRRFLLPGFFLSGFLLDFLLGFLLSFLFSRPVTGKLPCYPATSRAAPQRPSQRRFAYCRCHLHHAEVGEPLTHGVEVLVLIEGVERYPKPETLG